MREDGVVMSEAGWCGLGVDDITGADVYGTKGW